MRAALGFAACQSKKGNTLIIRLLPLQGAGGVWVLLPRALPWAMCFCPFGACYS